MGEVAAPMQTVQTPAPQMPAQNGFHLQRKCACGSYGSGGGKCDKCREDGAKLQRAAARSQTDLSEVLDTPDGLPEIVHHVLHSSGQPLDPTTRTWLEPRFGHDFSNVRVHTDARAAESAHAVNALAYTVGRDVVFGPGQYAPNTDRGNRLLAHELTHVVQQSRGGSAQQAKAISEPSDAAEVEADAMANRVMNSAAPVEVTQAPNATLHALTDGETAGAIAGSIAGAIGLGFGIAWLAGAFDTEHFSNTELTAYLTFLATNRRIEDHRDSDNKARDVVRHWRDNDPAFNINNGFSATGGALSAVDLKRLLIREMLSGVTAGDDENAILTILENSQTNEIVELLDPAQGVSVQDIDNKVGGENHDRFERLLEARLPRTGQNAAPQRRQTGGTCTARQSLMVDYARQRAVTVVNDAITALTTRANDSAVAGAINCWFPSATPVQLNQIRTVLEQVRNVLPSRVYNCGGEGGDAELAGMTFTGPQGQTVPVECVSEYAASFGMRTSTGQNTMFNDVFLCAQFFRQGADGQVVTIIHESVHATGITTDPNYNPSCGLSIATALTNPDSYAYLAMNLAQLQSQPASQGGQANQSGQSGQVQRKASDNAAIVEVPEEVDAVLRSPGKSLDAGTRAFMEQRFDRSFGDVRLHTDSAAAASARAVNAHAYTVGHDVVFGSGEYQPGTERGASLLAHELTHVVQQQNHAVAAQQTAKTVSEPSDAAEVEAERVAGDLLSGSPVQVKQAPNAAVHALTDGETAGVVGGVIGGLGLIGVGIAALTGAFDFSRFRACSPTWQRAINTATDTARDWIDNAVRQVDGVIRDPQNAPSFVIGELRSHFHIAPNDTANLNRLREGLGQIQSGFSSVTFECESQCEESATDVTVGYVPGLMGGIYIRYGRIHLCPRWFNATQPDEQPETIAHEMAHRFIGARGDVYRRAHFNAYHSLTTDQALENADSYAQFARVLFHMTSMNAAPANQAATQSGAPAGQTGGGAGAGSGGAPVQRKALGPARDGEPPEIVDEALRTSGEPLDVATRQWLEPRFGRDFSDVRVHRDQSAAQSARAVNAAAYTVGDDVVFGAGEYAPHTQRGAHLLAHELTHVAQQADGSQNQRAISHPADAAEVEAESVAANVLSGNAVQVNEARGATVNALPDWAGWAIAGGVVAGAGLGIAALLGAFDKAKFDNCPQEWQKKALAAQEVGRQWINDAVAAVDAVIAKPDAAEAWITELLQNHFKIVPTDKSGLSDLRDGLVDIQSSFGKALFKCEDKCGGSDDEATAGYTNALLGPYLAYGRIHLCPIVFEDQRAEVLAETIVHEMAHRFAGRNSEEVYRKMKPGTYWKLSKESALGNADSFAQFAKDVSTRGPRKAKDAKDKEEKKDAGGEVKRKVIGVDEPQTVPRSVHEVLHSTGKPLDEGTRDWMEPRFAEDLSDVKIHADARAAQSARDVNAAAYTVGRDVIFGDGRYEPQTTTGRELLAHELTHVVQQREHSTPSGSLEIGRDAGSEHEADHVGHEVAHGGFVASIANSGPVVSRQILQRQPLPEAKPTPESPPAREAQPAHQAEPAPEAKPAPEATPERELQPDQSGGIPVIDETSGMRGYPVPPGCVDVLWAREYERSLRLDTISVIGLSARPASEKTEDVRAARQKNREFQRGLAASCMEFADVTHPFRVRFYYLDTDLRTTDRVKVNTEDAQKNRTLGDNLGASQSPRVNIFVEHDSEKTEDFSDAKTLTANLKKIIDNSSQSAARRGAKTGLIVGSILGGLTTIGVGIGVGAAVAGGGASIGAAIGWGALAGSVAGGAVLGLSAGLGALFGYAGGTDRGTQELSKERVKEVMMFVALLRKTGEVKGKELTSSDSDNLARDAVTLWIDSPARLPLTVKDRRLLIKVMFDGPTLDDDERAIIKLFENSTDAEVLQILEPTADEKERVTIQMLDAEIHGEEWKQFRQMLQARFPSLGAPKIQRTETKTEPACEADQAIIITQALKRASEVVPIAQQRLADLIGDPKNQAEALSKVRCYFPAATLADVAKIKGMFDSMAQLIPSSRYVCLGKKIAISQTPRGPRPVQCESSRSALDVAQTVPYYEPDMTTIKSAMPETYLCPTFFEQGPIYQATSLIHEWVHRVIPASEIDDPVPNCGDTKLATALSNPDSYALLARDLAEGRTTDKTGQPTVTIGGFRNAGPPTPENRCVSCTQIPGLGVDPMTGANFMELRGDITGHRSDAFYDFKRTKEVGIWFQMTDGNWMTQSYEPPATPDDASADDEDTVPKFNQIYSIDGPGLHVPLPSAGDDRIKAGVYKGAFVESVNVKVGDGPWTPSSNQFEWHSLTWFERGDDGLLRRTPTNNEIAPGTITVGKTPPQP